MQRHAVHDRGHAEFTHAVADVVAGLAVAHRMAAFPVGQVGTGQVGRTAEELGQRGGQRIDRDLRCLAGGDGFGLGVDRSQFLGNVRLPVGGQFALHAALELGAFSRVGFLVFGELVVPQRFQALTLGLGIPAGVDVGRHFKRFVVPAHVLAGSQNFVVAQRSAVHVVGAGLVGRTLADDGLAADQGGLVAAGLGLLNRSFERNDVMAVDAGDHVPAVGFKALGGVVGIPVLDVTIDRDAVVVPEGDQLVELPGAGQRTGFVRNAFHHAAVAHEHIGVVVDDGVVGLVEFVGENFFRHRHADGIGNALAERTGGGFHAGRVAILGVTRRLGMQLTELLEVVHRQVVAGQVQQCVNQHRAMAVRQHKAVTVRPLGVGGVMAHMVIPQRFSDFRHAHGGTGVAGFGFFDCIHCKCADGIGQVVTGWHCVPFVFK